MKGYYCSSGQENSSSCVEGLVRKFESLVLFRDLSFYSLEWKLLAPKRNLLGKGFLTLKLKGTLFAACKQLGELAFLQSNG